MRSLVRGPRLALERFEEFAVSLATMVNRHALAPRTSINGRTGRHRRLAVVRVPLGEVKEIRAALGGR